MPGSKNCYLIILGLFGLMQLGQAQSLSPADWSEPSIRFLQRRGYGWGVSPLARPIAAQEMIACLAGVDSSAAAFAVKQQTAWLRRYLDRYPESDEQMLVAVQSAHQMFSDRRFSGYGGRQRLTFGMRFNRHLEGYNTMVVDSRLDNDPQYLGIRQNGLAGFTEQAYLRWHNDKFEVKIGRDYLRLGPGFDSSLLISDHARPLDLISLGYHHRYFDYSFYTGTLDPTRDETDGSLLRQLRYLSVHRLEIRPMKNWVVAIQEAILFGGPGAGYNLALVNPFIFYHGEQLNGPDDGNTIGSLQLAVKPYRNGFIYADLLIDDIQLERSIADDQEPSEMGLTLGFNQSELFRLTGSDLFIEYSRVTPRTYNSISPWEKWLHRRQPLGHFLGNDFERWLLGLQVWPQPQWRAMILFDYRKRGQGTIEAAFDQPWLLLPKGATYSEPFPTGVVETSQRWSLEVTWQPRWWLQCQGNLEQVRIDQKGHISGEDDAYWQGGIRFVFEILKKFAW